MSNTAQTNIETLLVALIKTQAPFSSPSTILVGPGDSATDTVLDSDRVSVKSDDPTPFVSGHSMIVASKVKQAMVEVTITLTTADVAKIDAWMLAIETAFGTAPAGIVTQATTLFPNGFAVEEFTQTQRNAEGSNQLTRTKTARVLFVP